MKGVSATKEVTNFKERSSSKFDFVCCFIFLSFSNFVVLMCLNLLYFLSNNFISHRQGFLVTVIYFFRQISTLKIYLILKDLDQVGK